MRCIDNIGGHVYQARPWYKGRRCGWATIHLAGCKVNSLVDDISNACEGALWRASHCAVVRADFGRLGQERQRAGIHCWVLPAVPEVLLCGG